MNFLLATIYFLIYLQKSFQFTNFTPNEQFLPMFLMTGRIRYSMMVKFDGKLLRAKKMVNLFSVKLFGELRN